VPLKLNHNGRAWRDMVPPPTAPKDIPQPWRETQARHLAGDNHPGQRARSKRKLRRRGRH